MAIGLDGTEKSVHIHWRKCITVGMSFDVSYAQAMPSVSVQDKDLELSALSPAPCLKLPCPTMMIMN